MAKLTAKQEGFCLDVIGEKSQADAYRANYNAGEMSDKTIWEAASRLMANSKVAARLNELRAKATEHALESIESLVKEYNENRIAAFKLGQSSGMNAATTGKAKLLGLLVERVDARIVEVQEFDVVVPGVTDGRPNGHDKAE